MSQQRRIERRREARRKVELEVVFAKKIGMFSFNNWSTGKIINASSKGAGIKAENLPKVNDTLRIYCVMPTPLRVDLSPFYKIEAVVRWANPDAHIMGVEFL